MRAPDVWQHQSNAWYIISSPLGAMNYYCLLPGPSQAHCRYLVMFDGHATPELWWINFDDKTMPALKARKSPWNYNVHDSVWYTTTTTDWHGYIVIKPLVKYLHVQQQGYILDEQHSITIIYYSIPEYISTRNVTHCGRETHICVRNLTIIGSGNGLSAGRRQAIIRTNAVLLLIGPLETYFSESWIKIQQFSLKKIHSKMSS